MIKATDNLGNSRELYIIICMDAPKYLQLVQEMRNWFFDVHKWYNDVKIEQVVLRILILIWEMNHSDLEKT